MLKPAANSDLITKEYVASLFQLEQQIIMPSISIFLVATDFLFLNVDP